MLTTRLSSPQGWYERIPAGAEPRDAEGVVPYENAPKLVLTRVTATRIRSCKFNFSSEKNLPQKQKVLCVFLPKTTVLGNGFSFLLNFFLFPKRKKFSCSPKPPTTAPALPPPWKGWPRGRNTARTYRRRASPRSGKAGSSTECLQEPRWE